MRGFKIQIIPTKEQEAKMWQHVGASRFIWNYMLDLQESQYRYYKDHISRFSMIKLLTELKGNEEFEWLKDVSNTMLQVSCSDLDRAYQMFFKSGFGRPKFKSRKKSKPRFPVNSENVYFDNNRVNIEKVGKLKFKTDFEFTEGRKVLKVYNARVSYNEVKHKWFLSFTLECESQAPELTDETMGIDLGIKELAAVAVGDKELVFHNINKSKQARDIKKRIRATQRSISRKYEANRQGRKYNRTRNIEKQEAELRRLHYRLSNIRRNYTHQVTHALVSMLPRRITMEDLNVAGMLSNHRLAEAVAEQNFYEFKRQMLYKCEQRGIELVEADRFYGSSRTCSCCGAYKRDLKLSDRVYRCSECSFEYDRDMNAARNLKQYIPH